MPKNEMTRAYTISDADLKQKADALVTSINRDMANFATRNITKDKLTAFSQLIEEFDATSTDEELLGMVKIATEQKDATVAALQPLLRTIRNMAELAFEGKGKFHLFGFNAITNLSDNDLYRFAKRVHRMATRLLPELATQGLTQELLNSLENLHKQLDIRLDSCAEAIENRDIETQDRITKGNALYAELIKLASVGKSLFEDTDEARFNDYVMIGSAPAPAPVATAPATVAAEPTVA